MQTFSEHLKQIMKDRDISQADLSRDSKVPNGYISMILSGKCRPSLKIVSKILDTIQLNRLESLELWIEAGFVPDHEKQFFSDLISKNISFTDDEKNQELSLCQ